MSIYSVSLLLAIGILCVTGFALDDVRDPELFYEPVEETRRYLQGPPLANYTSGFWRSNYFDASVFVQAEVLAIGVCYAATNFTPTVQPTFLPTVAVSSSLTPAPSPNPTAVPISLLSLLPLSIVYRKLVSVTQNKGKQSVTLLYSEHTDSTCTNSVRTYSSVQKLRDTAVTSNGVQLSVQRQFVTAFPPTLPGRYTVGYIIRYDHSTVGNTIHFNCCLDHQLV